MNILVNDPNQIVPIGISALVEDEHHAVIACKSIYECINILNFHNIGVFITELTTELDNAEKIHSFLQRLQVFSPAMKIVVLTDIDDFAIISFFSKTLKHIRVLKKKDSLEYIKRNLYEFHFRKEERLRSDSEAVLSRREFFLMKLFGSEINQQNIAKKLSISPKTVSHYKRSICEKLKCDNASDFYRKLNRLGFLSI